MIRLVCLFIFCVILSTGQAFGQQDAAAQEEPAYILSDVEYEVHPDFSLLLLSSSERIDFVYYEIENPHRIIVDLIGVTFCELEEHLEFPGGSAKAIDIVKLPYAQVPEGLGKDFYCLDYIIITPLPDTSFSISKFDKGRVIVLEISAQAEPAQPEPAQPEPVQTKPAQAPVAQIQPPMQIQSQPDVNIIDCIYTERLENSSLVVFGSKKPIAFKASKPEAGLPVIMLEPDKAVFTDIEEKTALGPGAIKSIEIVKDKEAEVPQGLDEYFYPVKNILIETREDLEFDLCSDEASAVSVMEIYLPKPGLQLTEEETAIKKEVIAEIKEKIKQQVIQDEKKQKQARQEAQEQRKLEASYMAKRIGEEVLEDVIVKGEGLLDVAQAQEIASANNPQLKIAKEEEKLAKQKRNEALRAFFPQVKLKGSRTTGEVIDVDFIEEVYGVQGEHSIYQGGRAWNTYKQSKVNLKLAESRSKKSENDLNYKVTEAYYNVVIASMNLKLQRDLKIEAEKILKSAHARHDSGLSTNLEILNVKAAYNQVEFQIAAAERDLALSRFKLQQVMSLDIGKEQADMTDVDTELPFKMLDIQLEECLELAYENHPDILTNRFLVESNEFGEKIAKGRNDFKVDVTGFYGKSDSYYETEEKKLQDDWNIGIKVSRPFWPATPSYSYSREETSRKVGQTDRTSSEVYAGELAILDKDAISGETEIKEAKINRQKAENELIEARRSIALEVKEAYYNYQEAIIKVKNNLEKVRFNEEAVKMARAQVSLNEGLQSQLMEAIVKLADEKSVYIKALSDYNIALAKINKAVGIKDYFKLED